MSICFACNGNSCLLLGEWSGASVGGYIGDKIGLLGLWERN